jgi:uncharacterized protein (TIGR02217 family)
LRQYLASRGQPVRRAWVKRFAPRLWSIDFPRPMMAALTNPSPAEARVDLCFLQKNDLAGLIWTSEDRLSHPLLAYATERDYRGCTLTFDWASGPGLMPLDAVNGPTLTIEGRDPDGVPRTWLVRLWNHADGSPTKARIQLDFDSLDGGFLLPDEADPVWAGDIDRMFISLVPADYDGSDTPLSEPVNTWVEVSGIHCSGARGTIGIGDACLPEHRVRMASGYDDSYNQAPERLVEQWFALGYRGLVNHYVGMSHFFALRWRPEHGRFLVDDDTALCIPAETWHRRLAEKLASHAMGLILSLSYELFDAHAPAHWAQRNIDNQRALTGYTPPSTLLSPCSASAMEWLQNVARALVRLATATGVQTAFQVGEPWWWVGPDGKPCFYDSETLARWLSEHGVDPPAMHDVAGARSAPERGWLDWLGARLAESTLDLAGAARAAADGELDTMLLFYAPQVLNKASPDLIRANMPIGWARPAFDVLQLEDYTFVTSEDEDGMERGQAAVDMRLGYPRAEQHYLAGFVAERERAQQDWPRIGRALETARRRAVAERFVWAWPQVARDGFILFDLGDLKDGEQEMLEPFHDGLFPVALGLGAAGGPEFNTQVAALASGFEQRNAMWGVARLRYDAGIGVRSESDLAAVLAFFRARRGQAQAFRFRDPMDHSSDSSGFGPPGANDQLLGAGDGMRVRFPLLKRYGGTDGEERPITRPVQDSVRIAVRGEEQMAGWEVEPLGVIRFHEPPALGDDIRGGFLFDVPARFATDRLDITLTGWRAGDVPSIPIIEVREDRT